MCLRRYCLFCFVFICSLSLSLCLAFGRQLLSGITQKLGWEPKEGEDHLTKLLRSLILARMTMLDDAEVIAEAERRFALHVEGKQLIPADFRSTVYKAVLRSGSRQMYDALLQIYREATLHEEKDRVASALGTVKNEDILKDVDSSFFNLPLLLPPFSPGSV